MCSKEAPTPTTEYTTHCHISLKHYVINRTDQRPLLHRLIIIFPLFLLPNAMLAAVIHARHKLLLQHVWLLQTQAHFLQTLQKGLHLQNKQQQKTYKYGYMYADRQAGGCLEGCMDRYNKKCFT